MYLRQETSVSLLNIPANLKRLPKSPLKEAIHFLNSENLERLMEAKGKEMNQRKKKTSHNSTTQRGEKMTETVFAVVFEKRCLMTSCKKDRKL